MARINIHDESVPLDRPFLVEGLPGVGLVGKIATDHLIEEFSMTHYASVHCDGLPQIGVYHEDDDELKAPVRLYADPDRDLLALQSEVPISGAGAPEFAACVSGWLAEHEVTPVYLSGRPAEKEGTPEVYGVATGDAINHLDRAGIVPPRETGVISGPTGALLNQATESGLASVGLIVESDPNFPDPEAARALLQNGIAPIVDVEVDVDRLVEQAERIRDQREQLAQRMQQAGDEESTQARPVGMYQ
ncbi:proteasome assembly chaperone family protein [Halalkalicoccus sp. NIPERK01]|uniref:proteasome assembly chaperone family protein n=1 Tax=Halalkalicoccus sp. NIPERK01 TaxID=3053469 RepID=UPI00256ECA7E|nr:proteasome assembly chaperone family protein [Halalkalicoccus sp. NIPERK01]MDL5361596.1 proteasome assembly chaperone family protein [Halalkalicoccus sp. NIPERK01]